MTTTLHRTSLPLVTSTGRRNGIYILVTHVDTTINNTRAFQGEFIKPDHENDLPVGHIVVRRTPTGSSRKGTWDWHHAQVPLPNHDWRWSKAFPQHKFLEFRDTVATKLYEALPPHPNVDRRTFIKPTPPPHTPTPIGDARQLFNSLQTVAKDPGLDQLEYNHAQGGFLVEGHLPQDLQTILDQASIFMDRVVHASPRYLDNAFQWQNGILSINATEARLLKAYYGVDPATFHSIIDTATKRPPPDPTLADTVAAVAHEATASLPILLKETWKSTAAQLAPMGFTLQLTHRQDTVHLFPTSPNRPILPKTKPLPLTDTPFQIKGHVLFPINDPAYEHTEYGGMFVRLVIPDTYPPNSMESACGHNVIAMDGILIHDDNPPSSCICNHCAQSSPRDRKQASLIHRHFPEPQQAQDPDSPNSVNYLAVLTIGSTNWAGRHRDTKEHWRCTQADLTPQGKALHATLERLYPRSQPCIQTWLDP